MIGNKAKASLRNVVALFPLVVVTILLILLLPQNSWGEQLDSSAKLKRAESLYKSASFDQAIKLLTKLSIDPSLNIENQKEALRFLSLCYTAKGLYDKAKKAISKLLELEPPLIELDPDREPPPLMRIYYEVRKHKPPPDRPDPGIKTIAILDFKNRSIYEREKFDPMEKGFVDLMISQLHGVSKLKVIERERIQWILDEIGLENDPERFDMNSAVRVGKQLGVHTVLLGSFINSKKDMWIGARLVKVETSEILLTEQTRGKADKFFELTQKLGVKITKAFELKVNPQELGARTETRSLDAMISYSEGLFFLEQGDYKKAYEKFQKALDYDPDYIKAHWKAESIKPFIG